MVNENETDKSIERLHLLTDNPHVAKSAGFSRVFTYDQQSKGKIAIILATRFLTYTVHVEGSLASHYITTFESERTRVDKISTLNTRKMRETNWARSQAACSSRRGIVTDLIGATRVFAHMKLTKILPHESTNCIYMTVQKASSDASQKPINLRDTILAVGEYERGIVTFSNSDNSRQ